MGQAKLKGEKADALLSAFERFIGSLDKSGGAVDAFLLNELVVAHKAYKSAATQPSAESPVSATGAQDFTCPHCGEWNPPYGWHYNIGDTGLFALQWITCFCGSCKTALTVNIVQFLPRPELMEKLKAQFAGKIVQA